MYSHTASPLARGLGEPSLPMRRGVTLLLCTLLLFKVLPTVFKPSVQRDNSGEKQKWF